MKVYQATCAEFDDHYTGFYATEQEALDAFRDENIFSAREWAKVRPFASEWDSEDPDVIEAACLLANQGSPSPALGIESTC